MRILLVIPTLDQSGAEKQFTLLATGLPRPEFEVRAVALTRGGPYAAELARHGVPLTVLGKRSKCDVSTFWGLRRIVRTWRPDIVHTWLFAANTYGRLVAGGAAGPPVIVSERCVDRWKAGWQRWCDRRLRGRTACLVGNSEAVADFYRGLGVPAERVRVIRNGIRVPDSETLTAHREAARGILGNGDPQTKIVMYVGRLAPQKRVADLIWAFELLRAVRDHVRFVIVGDGPERRRLEEFAVRIRAQADIAWLGHRADAAELLPGADAFWLASEFEGQSNSLLEALAAGLPAVVSDIPPNRELVQDGVTGQCVPVGDPAAFARATRKLWEAPDQAAQLGAAAREFVRSQFGIERMVQEYAALYRAVGGGR